jgi:hypothetical protein
MARDSDWTGRKVVDRDGNKLGKLDGVYRRHGSDEVAWGVVKRGPLGRKRHFVPLSERSMNGGDVRVDADKQSVHGSPALREREELTPETETRLHDHYGTHHNGDGGPSRRDVIAGARERQREEYGGFNIGAAFFGWLVATGLAVLLTAILSAAGAAIGLSELSGSEAKSSADTISIVGGALLLLMLIIAYYAGGYVAGRLSRFDGARQGVGAWLFGLLVTLLLAAAGAIFGSEYNVLAQLNLPRIPVDEGSLATGGLIALAAILIGTLLAALVGGKAGERYHKKIDRVALDA